MKIALIVAHFYPAYGGHEYYLAKELGKSCSEVVVYTSDITPRRYVAKLTRLNDHNEYIENGGKFTVKRFRTVTEIYGNPIFTGLLRALIEDKPDIIHTPDNYKPCSLEAYRASKKSKTPFIFTQHMYDAPIGLAKYPWIIINTTLGEIVRKKANYAIAVSSVAKEFLIHSRMDPHRIRIIPLGVDATRFTSSTSGKKVREKFEITDNVVILFVGRLIRMKGVYKLLKVFSIISKTHPESVLIICGKGELRNELIRAVRSKKGIKNRVIFIDYVPHKLIPQLYAACDIFVLPSTREVFGLSLLEAMASEKAVIGSCVGGIKDIIIDGIDGFLIKKGDMKQIASKLSLLLSDTDLRHNMGKKAREKVLKHFNYPIIARKTLELYKEVIK